jgi:hypothetical protein
MKTKFTLPTNIISNNVVKNVLYVITLALAVSYIINEENIALLSLALIACGVYAINKNIVIALFISIIITNILLAMNYFKTSSLLENVENMNNCCPEQPFYKSNVITYCLSFQTKELPILRYLNFVLSTHFFSPAQASLPIHTLAPAGYS